jgi:hypothetical protein
MEEIDTLLNHVSVLHKQNEDKEIFNVFQSLGFKSQETMHSKFIASLLDPKDQHGKKHSFLQLFLNLINPDFKIDNVKVKTEKSVHKRRIDISIENNDSIIIIENKIFAGDQDQQLEDYFNFCKEEKKNVELVYLTLYGNPPSDKSLGETLLIARDTIKSISYEKEIIPWITECVNQCVNQSEGRLKTSLEMYNELLHVLINRNGYMNKIFKYLKEDPEKLKAALDISSALERRHYLNEFPEAKEYLKERVYTIFEDMVSESDPNTCFNDPKEKTILSINSGGEELRDWSFYLNDGDVYVQNDLNPSQCITLFKPQNMNDPKLRSLIFKEEKFVDEWLTELFVQIREYK